MFKGVFSALITPLDEKGKLNKAVLRDLIEDLLSDGADGFYLCGATGEGLNLTVEQHKETAKAAIEIINGRVPAIVHVARTVFSEMTELAKYAESVGASAVSAIPPIFYKYNDDEIYSYYKTLADSINIPVVIYNNPSAGVAFPVSLLKRLFSIPRITSIKWTNYNFATVMGAKAEIPKANFISGPDQMLLLGLTAGCDAGIGTTYNFIMRDVKNVYEAFSSGDGKKALEYQTYVSRVCAAIGGVNIIMVTKFILSKLGYDVYYPIPPMQRLTEQEEEKVLSALREAGMKI